MDERRLVVARGESFGINCLGTALYLAECIPEHRGIRIFVLDDTPLYKIFRKRALPRVGDVAIVRCGRTNLPGHAGVVVSSDPILMTHRPMYDAQLKEYESLSDFVKCEFVRTHIKPLIEYLEPVILEDPSQYYDS